MKKGLFIVAGLCICFSCFSQLAYNKNNEIKFNCLSTLVGKYPEISYERYWGKHVGTGLSVGFPLKGSELGETNRFQVIPYGRFYFLMHEASSKQAGAEFASGGDSLNRGIGCLFIELNTGFIGISESSDIPKLNDNATKFGLGFAVGYRFLGFTALWGLTGEAFVGLGWGVDDFEIAYPRIGVSIGKTF